MTMAVNAARPRTAPLANAATITWRNLLGYLQVPQAVFFSSLQPVMFVLLFRYVFGGAFARALPAGASYAGYMMPGIFVIALAFGATGTAIGLAEDLHTGLIERFAPCRWRAPPSWPAAPEPTCAATSSCSSS